MITLLTGDALDVLRTLPAGAAHEYVFLLTAGERCIAAYGDAVLPQITGVIARSIIAVSPSLAGGGGSVARTPAHCGTHP